MPSNQWWKDDNYARAGKTDSWRKIKMDFCLTPNEVKVGSKWNKDLNMKGKLESQSKKIWKDSLKIKAGKNFLEWQKHKPQTQKLNLYLN